VQALKGNDKADAAAFCDAPPPTVRCSEREVAVAGVLKASVGFFGKQRDALPKSMFVTVC